MKLKHLLFLLPGTLLLSLQGCSGDDDSDSLVDELIKAPSFIQVTTAENKATITGKADAGSELILKYNVANGQVLRQTKIDASGSFSLSVDLLVDYEQSLVAYATKGSQISETVTLTKIPAKATYAAGWETAKTLLQSQRWKSDQIVSRMIIKQTAASPPYDLFATTAQKYFDFKAGGVFHFEVTSPLQFTHATGTWSMDDNGVMTISTMIPLGPMLMEEAKIQELSSERLTLLTKVSDGLFLLSFTK